MLEVHAWEPDANSGKPPFGLHEKGVPFIFYDTGIAALRAAPRLAAADWRNSHASRSGWGGGAIPLGDTDERITDR